MKRRGLLAIIGIAIAILLLWLKFGGSWAIDRCVDSGGFWDERAQACRR